MASYAILIDPVGVNYYNVGYNYLFKLVLTSVSKTAVK